MRKLRYLVLVLVLASFKPISTKTAKKINWVTLEEAITLQKNEPRKIIMDVYTNWCGPCKMLDRNTLQNPDVVNYINTHYYAVKFNAEGNATINYKDKAYKNPRYNELRANRRNSLHEFARFLKVSAYPTMAFFDEKGDFITPISGYLKPQELELYLKLFNSDDYKDMATQEKFNTYYKAFKPQFKR